MKKLLKSIFALLLLASILSSCSKDSTLNPSNSAAFDFSFKADGGATVNIDSANAVLYTTNKVRTIDVYAYKSGKQVLEFHFLPKTGNQVVGTTFGSGAYLTYMDSPTSSYDSQSGSFNLSVCDTIAKKIVGTFSFVGKPYPYTSSSSHTITEGKINVIKFIK